MKANIAKEMRKIKKPWTPVDLARVNDHIVRMALFKGSYHWHSHKEDELFLVAKGRITVEIKNGKDIILTRNEIAVVPKSIVHRTKSEKGAYVLMFEPSALKSKGD
ncbi:MAG: cupin domain-containing protein [Candidatus Aenigmarchaeota archaeon]|nr:cupin domain-containing protein [Candidatus Aenigmarchaeota archaeon]